MDALDAGSNRASRETSPTNFNGAPDEHRSTLYGVRFTHVARFARACLTKASLMRCLIRQPDQPESQGNSPLGKEFH